VKPTQHRRSLPERADDLLLRYDDWSEEVEALIKDCVDFLSPRYPGMLKSVLRQTEIDSKALSVGYNLASALRTAREKVR
jgi:hypothetical protein